MKPQKKKDNGVNDSTRNATGRVAPGSGGSGASSVVNQRNPCKTKTRTSETKGGNGKKNNIKVGTWNVRTMLRPGKLSNVIDEMKRADLNILGLAETRWREEGDF